MSKLPETPKIGYFEKTDRKKLNKQIYVRIKIKQRQMERSEIFVYNNA